MSVCACVCSRELIPCVDLVIDIKILVLVQPTHATVVYVLQVLQYSSPKNRLEPEFKIYFVRLKYHEKYY